MRAIYKNEVATYFSTLIGYIVIAFLLLFAGIFTSYLCLKRASAHFEYVMANMTLVFLIVVPILTMRTFSEERKQKTEALLYSAPVTTAKIVFGKYLALLTVLAIPLAIISLIPLALGLFGRVYYLSSYVAIGGFFLLGAALLAVGMFISSLTDIQILAAGLTFVLLLVNYFLGVVAPMISTEAYVSLIALLVLSVAVGVVVALMVKNWIVGSAIAVIGAAVSTVIYLVRPTAYTNLLMVTMRDAALFDRYNTLMYSIVNGRDLLLLISVAVFFVFLTVQSLEKRRWS